MKYKILHIPTATYISSKGHIWYWKSKGDAEFFIYYDVGSYVA